MRTTLQAKLAVAMLIVLSACAAPPAPAPTPTRRVINIAPDAHDPPFATVPYQAISRESVVAIALREWRLFGQLVDDDPPGTRPPLPPDQMPERMPGLWQRVGEYWWEGMDAGTPQSAWTGKYDGDGTVIPARKDDNFAWSAAFISYVMRIAGAGARFPYAEDHSYYINIAKEMALGETTGWIITAERPSTYAPQLGDLICEGRGRAARLTYDRLPTGHFPAHCDVVVKTAPGQITVVGGNVDHAVTMKHVPVTPDGKLATPDGQVLDGRYPWMVVLRVLYPSPVA
jgi:hypothetical protein